MHVKDVGAGVAIGAGFTLIVSQVFSLRTKPLLLFIGMLLVLGAALVISDRGGLR